MILHQTKKKYQNNYILTTARVESNRFVQYIPDSLLTAMALHEDIEVRGDISPKLFCGLQEDQRVFSLWFPNQLKHMDIRCELITPNPRTIERTVGAASSGGVDSLYTLWFHLSQNQPLEVLGVLLIACQTSAGKIVSIVEAALLPFAQKPVPAQHNFEESGRFE